VRERRLRPIALLATVGGIVVALVALTQSSWTHLGDVRGASDHSHWVIVFDDPAGRHTVTVWALSAGCAVTALAAGWTSALWSLLLRCAAPLLAGALVLLMVWQVVTYDVVVPSGVVVEAELAAGFWWTLAGLALVALGSGFGATRARCSGG
jgi:hypothetical protein